jgi:plastocyanin
VGRWLVALALLLAASAEARAAVLTVVVRDQRNEPLPDAVVVAAPRDAAAPMPARPSRETVDQIDKEFVPYVKAVPVGTPVYFPNKDNIRHHVYSFSPAKTFELPLYTGTPAHPVLFDRPGVVTIGCNIHDWMIGYIYVAPTPYVGTTRREGQVRLDNLPPGTYTVRAWHPRMQDAEETMVRTVTLGAGGADAAFRLTLKEDPRPRRAPVPGQRGYR